MLAGLPLTTRSLHGNEPERLTVFRTESIIQFLKEG